MAFVKDILPNSIEADGAAVHQTSPSYVLTFIPWVNREIKDDKQVDPNYLDTQKPYIVVNDAVSITVSDSKSSPQKSLQVTLVSTDVNYSTAVKAGDFVFVNLINHEQKAREIHAKVLALKPINGVNDGFKGFFKVKTVTRSMIESGNGIKSYRYQISAAAFSEFNSVILYNPALQAAFNQQGSEGLFMALVGEFFKDIVGSIEVDTLVRLYIKILLGKSPKDKTPDIVKYAQSHFGVPSGVSKLMGMDEAKHINQLYHVITGLWKNPPNPQTDHERWNPHIPASSTDGPTFFQTSVINQGVKVKVYENWDRKNIWSIIMDTCNDPMNEVYTTFRISPVADKIVPTFIMRQKPFTNKGFEAEIPTSVYLDMPRWRLHPAMAKGYSFSTNDALRFNFVQMFVDTGELGGAPTTTQVSLGNFVEDVEDIARNGMRPYIQTSRFGYISKQTKGDPYLSVKWSKVLADWVMNGHLKENGSIHCVGIEDAIATGDNLEFDGTVYHIETITHTYSINPMGFVSFHTDIGLSHGISLDGKDSKYSEMNQFTRISKATEDYQKDKHMPGISEQQDRRTSFSQKSSEKPTEKRQKT